MNDPLFREPNTTIGDWAVLIVCVLALVFAFVNSLMEISHALQLANTNQ